MRGARDRAGPRVRGISVREIVIECADLLFAKQVRRGHSPLTMLNHAMVTFEPYTIE
jgi:hypothetical protein